MPIAQLRICLDPAEYARRRRPYFIRFMDGDFKFHQRKVESFSFVRDCVLEVCFDACETLPAAARRRCRWCATIQTIAGNKTIPNVGSAKYTAPSASGSQR